MDDFSTLRTIMVDTHVRPSNVTKYPIIAAMLAVEREAFVPDTLRGAAYADAQLPLDGGRFMLEPRTLAKMLDALAIEPDELVLDLGCGLGYSAAVIAQMADFVIAVEEPALAGEAEQRLAAAGVDNVAVIGGPLVQGGGKYGPFDVILIEGAIETLPETLSDQLKEGGRIGVIFADGPVGEVRIGTKLHGRIDWHLAFNASAPVLPGFEKAKAFAF